MHRFSERLIAAAFPVALSVALLAGGTAVAIGTGTVPAAAAQAQAGGPPDAPTGRRARMGQILLSLGLSDSQKTQIRAIMADARKKNQDVADPQTRRANFEAAHQKVLAVLTPAQRAQFEQKIAALHAQNPGTRPQ